MDEIEILINAPDDGLEEYLDRACAGDPGLRKRVDAFLEDEGRVGSFMKNAVVKDDPDLTGPAEPGLVIGNYKILQRIGEGGFGIVYMAEQLRPVKRRVALKIIKLGMDTRQVVARFEAERQALAMMEHPNIAKVLDAGATASGRPYFVMELVRGIPITQFCDEENLNTRQRLELFVEVCRAVQHAHQKGIIHRDLKPSNVMVTVLDDRPVPKVIDFGVAKATQVDLTEKTLFTRFEHFIGTPAYMSPEQAKLSGHDIDTRSDIYALGVLLYELLTGRTPFDPQQLARVGQDEVRRVIREDEPSKPSTRLGTLAGDELTTLAKQRRASPEKLRSLLRGDLDWIVMKSLEKDRTRRYDTANGLAADIHRHLANQAVEAGPPQLSYRVGKLLRRHRAAISAAAVMVILLVAGATTSIWQAVRATDKAREADSARIFAEQQQAIATDERRIATHRVIEEQFASDKPNLAIAQLAQLLRNEPSNHVAAERLMSALRQREFPQSRLAPLPGEALTGAFNHNGALIVAGSQDGKHLRVYDTQTGEPRGQQMNLPGGQTAYLASFSQDGETVVTNAHATTSTGGFIQAWDWKTGTPRGEPATFTGLTQVAEISPDSQLVVSGDDGGRMQVRRTSDGTVVTDADVIHATAISTAHFSPDSRRVVTGSLHEAQVWDARTGKAIGNRMPHQGTVKSARFDPEGKRVLTASEDGTARIWDATTGEPLTPPLVHSDRVTVGEFNPDGTMVLTASWDRTARLWDAATGRQIGDSLVHPGKVLTGEFSASGRRILTHCEWQAQVWDTGSGKPVGAPVQSNLGEVIQTADLSPDGTKMLAASWTENRLWDIRPGLPSSQIFRHYEAGNWVQAPHAVHVGRFNADGSRIITTGADQTSRVWDTRSGVEISRLLDRGKMIWAEFSADGKRALSTSIYQGVRVWNPDTGHQICNILGAGRTVGCARLSPVKDPEGRWLVATNALGEKPQLQIWDADTAQAIGAPFLHGTGAGQSFGYEINHVAFSPDAALVAGSSDDNTVWVWRVRTGEPVCQLGRQTDSQRHTNFVTGVTFSADRKQLLTNSIDGTAILWDITTGLPAIPPLEHTDAVMHAAISPDGKRIVTTSADNTAMIWDTATGTPRCSALQHAAAVNHAAFSPDSRRVATASLDGSARVWDVATGHPLSEPLHHDGWVFHAQFSPDGRQLLTTGDDSTARLWEMPPAPRTGVPDWIPGWAEAVVGMRYDADKIPRPLQWEERNERISAARAHAAGDDFYGKTVTWFYDDITARPISPFSPVRVTEFVARRLEETDRFGKPIEASLQDALRVAPGSLPAWSKLAEQLLEKATGDKRTNLLRARHYAGQARAADPGDPERNSLLRRIDQARHVLAAQEALDRLALQAQSAAERGRQTEAREQLIQVAVGRILLQAELGEPVPESEVRQRFAPLLEPGGDSLESGADWQFQIDSVLDQLASTLPEALVDPNRDRWLFALSPSDGPATRPSSTTDLEFRSTIQQCLLRWRSALEALEPVIANLATSSRPADVRRYKQLLRKKASLLRSIGASDQAASVTREVTARPPRDPSIDTRLIDLTRFYNQSFFRAPEPEPWSNNYWRERIAETLDPVESIAFDARGAIGLNSGKYQTGHRAGKDINQLWHTRHPMAVEGIPIGHTARKLHFLQSSFAHQEQPGIEVARYIVHYADATTGTIPVLSGRDMVDFSIYTHPGLGLAEVGKIAWQHPYRNNSHMGLLALTMQSWQNPHPDKTITHIDFVSAAAKAVPTLIAITTE